MGGKELKFFPSQVGTAMATALGVLQQAAAIPVHHGRICLVTSRSGKRWVVPKGCLEEGKSTREIALQEAWEEAGLVGALQPEPIGSYLYDKNGLTCHVVVYVLQVTEISDEWPESTLRERRWVVAADAAELIEERGLCELVESVAAEPKTAKTPRRK